MFPIATATATPATLRPPHMTKPTAFAGKGRAAACFFLTKCNNYILVSPMVSEEVQIRWALQQLEGNTHPWHEAQFASMCVALVPAHLATWNTFQAHFEACWCDPHEAEKAMNKLMSGAITQCTSIGVYNNLFNELLALTAEDSTNGAVLTCYMNGLKTAVRVAAVPSIKVQPNITFEECQALMVEMDKLLQQADQNTMSASTSQSSHSSNHSHNTTPSS